MIGSSIELLEKRENQKVLMKPPIIKFAYNVEKVFENEMNVKNVLLVGKGLSAKHCKYLQRSPLKQFFATLSLCPSGVICQFNESQKVIIGGTKLA